MEKLAAEFNQSKTAKEFGINPEDLKDFADNGKIILDLIIKGFAQKGIVFTNESQFQFELGFTLQKLFYENESTRDYLVKFEVLSANEDDLRKYSKLSAKEKKKLSKEKKEKLYTDLVIEMSSTECIAIELKYKTSGDNRILEYHVNNKMTFVFGQGAYDNGCWDYWWDVYRLERLVGVKGHTKIDYNFTSNIKVVKGFAIIMANEQSYWTESSNTLFSNFRLFPGPIDNDTVCKWNHKNQLLPTIDEKDEKDEYIYKDGRYHTAINIRGKYEIPQWNDYDLPAEKTYYVEFPSNSEHKKRKKEYYFKYLILEVKE